LPEGRLRERVAAELKAHPDREFELLAALGRDLPGAVILAAVDTPESMRNSRGGPTPTQTARDFPLELRASLAGMQLKFSMLRQGQRFTFAGDGQLGNFILKPPSRDFDSLPRVEAATMSVAREVGIEVPEILLVEPSAVNDIRAISDFPTHEPLYAIRRFDRLDHLGRRHTEDFAQVFNLRTTQKYGHANYEQIARTLWLYAGGLDDVREMSRRLALNILMGNGDAHVKNWSLLYEDPRRPRLSPAYDLVATIVYTSTDDSVALNMGKIREFKRIGLDTFESFLQRVGLDDQLREDVMTTVISTGKAILESWERIFVRTQVPTNLIDKLRTHIAGLRLTRDLTRSIRG
jgi:serine/threonine-protein kinase HipA